MSRAGTWRDVELCFRVISHQPGQKLHYNSTGYLDNIVHIDHRTVYIPTFPLKPDEDRFIDAIASLLPAWNLTPGMGRVFGYLLLT
jgi:hypothetical protein